MGTDEHKVANVKHTSTQPSGAVKGGLLARERWLIALCAAVGLAVGGYRVWSARPKYIAAARLYVESTESSETAEASSPRTGAAQAAVVVPTEVLFGTEIADLAIQAGRLNELPCFAHADDLANQIIAGLNVKTTPAQSGRGQIQDLEFVCPDPQAAERVLEGLVAAYQVLAERWRVRHVNEMLASLEAQRKFLFERLQRKQLELERFKEAHPGALPTGDTQVWDNQLRTLVEARIRAELRRIEAEVRLASLVSISQATSRPAAPSPKVPEAPSLAEHDPPPEELLAVWPWSQAGLDVFLPPPESGAVGLGGPTPSQAAQKGSGESDAFALAMTPLSLSAPGYDLEAEEQSIRRLEEVWGPQHPKLQAAKARLTAMQNRARRLADQSIRSAEAYVRLCRESEERLQQAIERHQATQSWQIADDVAVEGRVLQQVVERTGKVLASVCNRIEQISLEAATGGGLRITTIVPPHATRSNTSDQTPKLLLVPVGVGLLVGFALTYLVGSGGSRAGGSRRVLVDRAASRSSARGGVLGWVPSLPHASGRGSQRALGTWILREPQSKAARSFRRLARQVIRAAAQAESRCILFTSAREREGRSVVLANLATAMAQLGRRILLIDAHYEHPSQHVLLSDILSLSGETPTELTPETFERGQPALRTQIETLWVVPAWPRPADPEALLKSAGLQEFVRQSGSKFDLILMDGPSLEDGERVELLAELADAVVFLADAADANSLTPRRLASRMDLPSLGVIVNTVPSGRTIGMSPRAAAAGARSPASEAAPLAPDPAADAAAQPPEEELDHAGK